MFGTSARVGLTSTSLPQEAISRLQTEQDMIAVLQNPNDVSDDTDESQHLTDLNQRQEDIKIRDQQHDHHKQPKKSEW